MVLLTHPIKTILNMKFHFKTHSYLLKQFSLVFETDKYPISNIKPPGSEEIEQVINLACATNAKKCQEISRSKVLNTSLGHFHWAIEYRDNQTFNTVRIVYTKDEKFYRKNLYLKVKWCYGSIYMDN